MADENGRFALVAGRFGLGGWLDGQLVRSIRIAPGIAKHPSPARVRRCWDTTRQFWLDLVTGRDGAPPELAAEDIIPARPFRLRIDPARVQGSLGDYHVYEWPLRGEISLNVVWVPEGQFVRPVFVRTGLSDEVATEIWGDGLSQGTKIVTGQDEVEAGSDGSNPFLPKIPRGGKGGPPPPI